MWNKKLSLPLTIREQLRGKQEKKGTSIVYSKEKNGTRNKP